MIGMSRLLSLGFLIAVTALLPEVAHVQGADSDGDGVPAATDNCAVWPNPGQSDVDGNGIGDACECGDQDGNGRVDVRDLIAINLAIFEPVRITPLCDTNDDDLCNAADIVGANDRIFGRPAYCSRHPSPGLPDADGDGFSPDEGDCDDDDAGVYPGAPVVSGSLEDGDLAQGSCFAAREPDGTDPRSGGDGCSGISVEGVLDADNPTGCPGADFGSGDPPDPDNPLPCDLHDACYATCGTTQALCDSAFLANMLAVCDDLGSAQTLCVAPCRDAALIYWGAVVTSGQQPWLNGQRRKCDCACDADRSACGNGVCSVSGGESSVNCSGDCLGELANGASCVLDADCASGECGPQAECTDCGNGQCEAGESCRVTSTASCQTDCGRCGAGNACEVDADCAGFCDALFICRAKLPNGSVCLKDSACAGGACNFGFCIDADTLPALTPCTTPAACRNGSCVAGVCAQICGDGFCDGAEVCGSSNAGLQCISDCGRCPNGTACTSNAICASNTCNFGFCVGNGSVPVGGACTTANACSNDICQLGCCGRPVTAACTSDSQCCSNNCVTDLLGNRSCALF